ncbi:hypothetical protein LWF15_21780 [Kineosporia rhizophila]|uniref:hypothetical protein n=1 Tax=Kineosporia rhizophila TaxID=84633 RepID=UPI000A917204|nr:hypothetical protein [Kineosporia rhizophila]MCE0538130.1 hypothetical protein [Kineosporia rhizophila]
MSAEVPPARSGTIDGVVVTNSQNAVYPDADLTEDGKAGPKSWPYLRSSARRPSARIGWSIGHLRPGAGRYSLERPSRTIAVQHDLGGAP